MNKNIHPILYLNKNTKVFNFYNLTLYYRAYFHEKSGHFSEALKDYEEFVEYCASNNIRPENCSISAIKQKILEINQYINNK